MEFLNEIGRKVELNRKAGLTESSYLCRRKTAKMLTLGKMQASLLLLSLNRIITAGKFNHH